ncbi:hypothetical protein [Desulfonatronum thiosulfatophilum]|uniref:hypothetical protein n=1 Tax=Desulfonatronum thiosulfatophilum TaxID=617002 RepID=UPI001FC9A87B|nr:hypothetical protein [Desulfonatronum thiosulfatophilum]
MSFKLFDFFGQNEELGLLIFQISLSLMKLVLHGVGIQTVMEKVEIQAHRSKKNAGCQQTHPDMKSERVAGTGIILEDKDLVFFSNHWTL